MAHKHLKGLNTLRFFAAFLVVIYHGKHHLNNMGIPFGDGFKILDQGKTAVDFFFVLSGFLITYLAISEIKIKGKINFKHFYIRRIFRIMPLYYMAFIIMLVFLGFIAPKLLSQDNVLGFPLLEGTLLYIGMLPNLVTPIWNETVGGMNIFWSIGVEEQFYLLFPLVIFGLKNVKNKILYLLTLFVLYFVFYWCIKINFFQFNSIIVDFVGTLKFHYMIMGIIFAVICHEYLFDNKSVFLQNLIDSLYFQIAVILIVFIKLFVNFEMYDVLEDLLSTLLFALLILVISHRQKEKIFKKDIKMLSYFGVISYGIYLLHPLVSYFLRFLIKRVVFFGDLINKFPFLYVVILLITTIIVAHFSYKYFEQFFLKLKNKYK